MRSPRRSAGCCACRQPLDTAATCAARPCRVEQRLAHLRDLLAGAASFNFDEAVEGADRMTEAVTLFALLELYKAGEAAWEQAETFGEITIRSQATVSDQMTG